MYQGLKPLAANALNSPKSHFVPMKGLVNGEQSQGCPMAYYEPPNMRVSRLSLLIVKTEESVIQEEIVEHGKQFSMRV